MSRRRKQNDRGRLFKLKLAVAGATFLGIAVWMVFGEGGFWDSSRLNKVRSRQAAKIELLEARKAKVREYLAQLEAGDEFAMETAARRYGLVASDETIYQIKIESSSEE